MTAPVTVLGLGPMGSTLARVLLDAGHPTTVWNRSPGKADALVAQGATLASSPAEAIAASELVIICVVDYDVVHAIVDPATDALRGRTLVNLTADTPARARTTAAWAERHGIRYVDGAIMTPTDSIGTPTAVFLYSGDEEAYESQRRTLASLGGTATHLGSEPGRAAAYDLALLDFFWTSMTGILHGLALARAEDIKPADFAPFAQGIAAILPPIVAELAENVEKGEHPGDGSPLSSNLATMEHVLHAAEERGIASGVMRAARDLARDGVAAGHGADNFSVLVELGLRADK